MKIILYLYSISIFMCLMFGAEAWFIWPIEKGIYNNLWLIWLFAITMIYTQKYIIKLNTTPPIIAALVFFSFGVVLTRPHGFAFIIGLLCRLFPMWVLLSDKKNFDKHLSVIHLLMTIILIPGIVEHFIILATDIPGFLFQREESIFFNYIFCIRPIESYTEYNRFFSVFLEPGYLGMLMAFLLYMEKYDFKRFHNVVYLIALAASLSLAGFILFFVGYFICGLSNKKSIKYFIASVLFVGVLYGIAVNYNQKENILYERIFSRLEPDEEKGFSGNNRFTEITDVYFDRLIGSGGILLGMGRDEVERINGGGDYNDMIAGAGYKVYLITDGLLSALLFFLFYNNLTKIGYNKRYKYGFLFIIVLTFIQAAYPQSFAWIIPFILAMVRDRYSRKVVIAS